MTDPHLVRRAEQAYLGAILARQGRVGTGAAVAGDAGPDGLASLRPQDFTDPVHQAIYAALAGQAPPRRVLGGLYDRLRGLLSRLLRPRARDASAYMAGLPGRCPDPANLPAYAAMVTEASEQRGAPAPAPAPAPEPRRAAAENQRLASAGEWLDGAGPRQRPPGTRPAAPAAGVATSRAERTAGDLPPDVARLARALQADARSATRGTPGTPRTPLPPESQPTPLDAETLQERVLADLMRRPADGRDITSWLPDTVFTAGPNRNLYQLISMRLADGRPVDPLIIAWDASVLRDPGGTAGTPEAVEGESLAAAALRLGALDPGPGTAATLGRALYAEHVCTDTFGPGWPEQLGRIQAPPPSPAPAAPTDPSRRPEPDPSAAGPAVVGAPERPAPSAAPAAEVEAEAEAASRAGTVPDAARHPMPALPRRVPSPLIQQPPAPAPAGPAPAQRI